MQEEKKHKRDDLCIKKKLISEKENKKISSSTEAYQ